MFFELMKEDASERVILIHEHICLKIFRRICWKHRTSLKMNSEAVANS